MEQPLQLFKDGQEYCAKGEFRMCFFAFDMFRTTTPDLIEGHLNAAVALERMGNEEAAILVYESALKSLPDHHEKIAQSLTNVLEARAAKRHQAGGYACMYVATLIACPAAAAVGPAQSSALVGDKW